MMRQGRVMKDCVMALPVVVSRRNFGIVVCEGDLPARMKSTAMHEARTEERRRAGCNEDILWRV